MSFSECSSVACAKVVYELCYMHFSFRHPISYNAPDIVQIKRASCVPVRQVFSLKSIKLVEVYSIKEYLLVGGLFRVPRGTSINIDCLERNALMYV